MPGFYLECPNEQEVQEQKLEVLEYGGMGAQNVCQLEKNLLAQGTHSDLRFNALTSMLRACFYCVVTDLKY